MDIEPGPNRAFCTVANHGGPLYRRHPYTVGSFVGQEVRAGRVALRCKRVYVAITWCACVKMDRQWWEAIETNLASCIHTNMESNLVDNLTVVCTEQLAQDDSGVGCRWGGDGRHCFRF